MIEQLKLSHYSKLMQRVNVGALLLLAVGGGEALAQTPLCLAPSMPIVGPFDFGQRGRYSLIIQIPESGVTYHAHDFRYRLVDAGDEADEEWWETVNVRYGGQQYPRLILHPSSLPEIPTSGANPGLFEVQVRRFCDEATHSEWSDIGVGNVSRPPYFRERMSTDPLEGEQTCHFDEGQTRAGADGRGCRLYGNDRDLPTSATSTGLVLEIEDEHDGNLFLAERDTLVGTDDPPSTALGNISDDDVQESLGHIWLVTFRMAPDFEGEQRPDHTYRVPLTLVDVYGVRSETLELRVQVQNVDEPDTWVLPAPQVGAIAVPTVTAGDRATVTSVEWARSADVSPRQWESIPGATGHYVPDGADEGQWLRATVYYMDVGGAKVAMVVADRKVLPNQPPTFDATRHGTRAIFEHARPGAPAGDPIAATDTVGDTLTYAVVDDAPTAFTIDSMTGQLAVSGDTRLDYETGPAVSVTVQVTDRAGATATVSVLVTLTDVAEDGTIAIAGESRVGQELVPNVREDDGIYGVFGHDPEPVLLGPDGKTAAIILWQWQVSMDAGTNWHDLPDGGQRNYVPLPAHAGQRLRVLAVYDSPEDPTLREMAIGMVSTPVATVPVVQSVGVGSVPDPEAGYTYGDRIQVAVTFSEAVSVTGTIGIDVAFDGQVRRSATRTDDGMRSPQVTWTLVYELVPGDPPAGKIGVPEGTLSLTAEGSVQNASGHDAVLTHPAAETVAQSVRTLKVGIPDVNQDGRLEAVDGLALYYADAWRAALGADPDDPADGHATLRATFLGPLLAADVDRTDVELRGLLRTADIMAAHGEPFNLDVTQNGVADGADGLALYYALTFPELLGGGDPGHGFSRFRKALLASLWTGDSMPRDQDLQQLLDRVQQLVP